MSIKGKLLEEVYFPLLVSHPFLDLLFCMQMDLVASFCRTAVEERAFARDDVIFVRNEAIISMLIVVSGKLTYSRRGQYHKMRKGSWICEPTIFIADWLTRGTLVSARRSELMLFQVEAFRTWLSQTDLCSELRKVTCEYAVLLLNVDAERDKVLPEPLLFSDLWISPEVSQELVQTVLSSNRGSWQLTASFLMQIGQPATWSTKKMLQRYYIRLLQFWRPHSRSSELDQVMHLESGSASEVIKLESLNTSSS